LRIAGILFAKIIPSGAEEVQKGGHDSSLSRGATSSMRGEGQGAEDKAIERGGLDVEEEFGKSRIRGVQEGDIRGVYWGGQSRKDATMWEKLGRQ